MPIRDSLLKRINKKRRMGNKKVQISAYLPENMVLAIKQMAKDHDVTFTTFVISVFEDIYEDSLENE